MTAPPASSICLRRVPWRTALMLLVAAGVWLGEATRTLAAEVIQSFDSNVRLARDGELTVTETVRVQAEGRDIRHGIYRDFPLTFKDANGAIREVDFTMIGVERGGKPERYSTRREHGVVRIYAGDKDTIVSSGAHTYVFRYKTGRQVRWFDGKPELNWNVTGNFWRFPILAASYQLQFVAGGGPPRWTAFTGRMGERGKDWRGSLGALGTLNVETTRRLAPGEGLTVVAEIPAEAIDAPTQKTLLWYEVFDNRRWAFGGAGLVLVLGYYLAAWNAVGRDPKGGAIIPLFQPPAGISPALANYIRDWGFAREKWRAFTAAALPLAVRGLLHFDDRGGSLTLKSTGKAPQGALPTGEDAIFTWVREQGGAATISSAHSYAVEKVGENFTKSIETENRNRFFRRNLGYVAPGVAMTLAVVAGVAAFGGLQDQDKAILTAFGVGGFIAGIFAVQVLQLVFSGVSFQTLVRGVVSVAFFVVFVSITSSIARSLFPNGLGETLQGLWSYIENFPFAFVLVTAFTTINGLFIYLMRAPTALGRPVMDQLAGFRLYLETAESGRLNMNAPEI